MQSEVRDEHDVRRRAAHRFYLRVHGSARRGYNLGPGLQGKYKRLKAEVEKQSKKLEKKKETITESAGRQQKKKIERQEEKLKNNNRDLSMVQMKSMFAIGFCFTALMGTFNSIFDGRVVAKLPFTPLSYIQGLSHRNLLGDDTTDCSFIFLYILCTMSIRQNIRKILGLAPSRAATKQAGGFLGPPPPSGKFS